MIYNPPLPKLEILSANERNHDFAQKKRIAPTERKQNAPRTVI